MINELSKKGAEVIYDRSAIIHVSGHACQEELKLMLSLIKPKYFIPVHGEYRMLRRHGELAVQTGVHPRRVIITDIGRPGRNHREICAPCQSGSVRQGIG